MNEEYKQWKKILANKKVLMVEVILGTFLIASVTNFLINSFCAFVYYFRVQEGKGLSQIGEDWSNFKHFIQEEWFWMLFPRFTFWGLVILLLVLSFFGYLLSRKIYKQRTAFKDINKGTKGTSRWTTIEELNAQYPLVPLDKKEYEGRAGVPVAFHPDRKHVWIDNSNTNVEVLGATQTGKTQALTYPTIDLNLRAKIPDSMLINDIKGDILRRTYFHPLARKKFHIRALNLIEPKNSLRYNPLYDIKQAYMQKDYAKAQRRAQTLSYILYNNPDAKEPVWDEGAMSIFEAVTLLLASLGERFNHPEWVNMTAFIDLLDTLALEKDKEGKTTLDYYFLSLPPGNEIRKAYSIALRAEKKQTSSFYMMVSSKLKYFFTEDMKYLTSDQDMDFLDLAYPKDGKPTLLFVVFPYADFSNAKILKMFFTQLYQKLAEETTLGKGAFDVRLRSWMEEAQNTPDIEGMERYNNVGLSAGFLFAWINQARLGHQEVYGEKRSKSILGAAGNTYYIKSDEDEESREFSEKLGPTTVIATQRSGDPMDDDKSFTEMEEGRQLLDKTELSRLMQGEWVLNRTKYTKDLKGNPIRPYPISAFYKENKEADRVRDEKIFEKFNLKNLKLFHKAEKDIEKPRFEPYMNAKFAYEYLFSEAKGDFDTKGKSLSDLELRENLSYDKKGKKKERVVSDEDLVIPHELLTLLVSEALNAQELREFRGEPEEKESLESEQVAIQNAIQELMGLPQAGSECADEAQVEKVQDEVAQTPPSSEAPIEKSEKAATSLTPEEFNARKIKQRKEKEARKMEQVFETIIALEEDIPLDIKELYGDTLPRFNQLLQESFPNGERHVVYLNQRNLSAKQVQNWINNLKKSEAKEAQSFLENYQKLVEKGEIHERSGTGQ